MIPQLVLLKKKKKTKNVLFQEYYAPNILLFISINKEFYELQCHSGMWCGELHSIQSLKLPFAKKKKMHATSIPDNEFKKVNPLTPKIWLLILPSSYYTFPCK